MDYKWYLDIMLKLIRIAGDFVSEEVRIDLDELRKENDSFVLLGLVSCYSSRCQSK